MVENIDIPTKFLEINNAIKSEDHETVLNLSEKILKLDKKDNEALQCKIVALINLSRNDDLITLLENSNLIKEYLLEYAYALHEKKNYNQSIEILLKNSSARKEISFAINELLAQNYYKLGNYNESNKIYKDLVLIKNDDPDLITNYLASYILSYSDELLPNVTKFLNSWEAFYNYCIICLKNGNFSESIETLLRIKQEYGNEVDEHKIMSIDMSILQKALDGYDYMRFTNIPDEYEKYFSNNKSSDLYPYFYNNFLHMRKDMESLSEIIKKYESFLKNENLTSEDRYILTINRVVFLLRGNKISEAAEIFNTIKPDFNDIKYIIISCYLCFKQCGIEKLEEILKTENNFKNNPESHLILLQIMLSTITSKNLEQFHLKVLNFIKQFFSYTINFHFLNFFIGFYESRHLKDYLKEFIRNYKDLTIFNKLDNNSLKKCLNLLGHTLSKVGLYEDSVKFYNYIIDHVDKFDKKIKLNLIDTLAHVDVRKSEEIRKTVDDKIVDLSIENINRLLNEVFGKSKQKEEKIKNNKKKKKKIRYPKNFDPKKPGPLPDPERWIPKLQRKKYRNLGKNKMAYQGGHSDNITTSSKK